MDNFIFYPRINSKGLLMLGDPLKLNNWMSRNKGKRLQAIFRVMSEDTSEKMFFYYKYYVLEECRKGFYELGESFTHEQVDIELRHKYTTALHEETELGTVVLDFKKAGNKKALEYLEQVKRFAAVNLQIVIDDPK